MRGEFCVLSSSCPAPGKPLLAAMFSNCYQVWLIEWQPLPAPALWAVNHRLQCSSKFALKLVSNRKMLKSCTSIGCTKRQASRVSFHIFPVGKVRQKQWLASLKLVNPPVLKHYGFIPYITQLKRRLWVRRQCCVLYRACGRRILSLCWAFNRILRSFKSSLTTVERGLTP